MNKCLIVVVFVFGSMTLWAQNTDLDTTFRYNVDIKEEVDSAQRNFSKIKELPPEKVAVPQSYSKKEFDLTVPRPKPKIPVYKIKQPPLEELKGNYAKAGFGNFVTPYLELFAASKRNREMRYGAHFKHRSSANGPIDERNSGNSDTRVDLTGQYYKNDHVLDAGVHYQRLGMRYYGYDTAFTGGIPETEDIEHLMNDFGFRLGLERELDRADLDYGLSAGYQWLGNNRETSESEFWSKGGAQYELGENSNLFLDYDLSFLTKTDSGSSLGRSFVYVKPHYRFKKGRVFIDAGLKTVIDNDTLSGHNNFHLYPSVLLDVILSYPPGLRVYAGLDGNMERQRYRDFIYANNFMGWGTEVYNANNTLHLYGGAKATILKNVTFDASIGLKTYERLYFFANDGVDRSRFNAVYDNNTTTVLNFTGELAYTKHKDVKAGIKVEANKYNLSEDLERAYHRPGFEASLFARYVWQKKLILETDMFFVGGLYGLDTETLEAQKLDPIIDLNLKAEYRINKQLSAFSEVNNLLSRDYQRYLYYPVRGINFLVGATYAF